MSATAFNRRRRQARALADAKARDDAAQNTPLNHRLSPEELSRFSREELPDMASPPYPDVDRLSSIPGDADLAREAEAAEQAELNKTRILSYEAREELQNSHWRAPKVKAIPDHDEAGQDCTLKGMADLREQAQAPYYDERSPLLDGRVRNSEPYAQRPDVDTTESQASRGTESLPTPEDDKPKTVGAIIERGNARALKKVEDDASVMLVPVTDDPKEMKSKGASKFVKAPPKAEVSEEPPAPAHTADPDMNPAPAPAPSESPESPEVPESSPKPKPTPAPAAEPPAEEEALPSAEEPKATRGRPKKS